MKIKNLICVKVFRRKFRSFLGAKAIAGTDFPTFFFVALEGGIKLGVVCAAALVSGPRLHFSPSLADDEDGDDAVGRRKFITGMEK